MITATKTSRIVKFSISIRREIRERLDQIANKENRSRSSMIDVICAEHFEKTDNAKKELSSQ